MKMEGPCEASNNGEVANRCLQIIKYSPYKYCTKLSSPWFHLRVFYVRVCGLHVDETTPEFLSLSHFPLSPDTLLEVNGVRSCMYPDGSSALRRDRVDKNSDEATFVNTDSTRLTGSVKFEVYNKEDCILSGVLEMLNSHDFTGESRDNNAKRWSMSCETDITAHSGFFRGKHAGFACPKIEVYVAGYFSATPIVLTKTLQLNFRRKHNRKCMLDSIPEYETPRCQKDGYDGLDLKAQEVMGSQPLITGLLFLFCVFQRLLAAYPLKGTNCPLPVCWWLFAEVCARACKVANYRSFKPEHEEHCNSMYWRRAGYMDWEDSELSWFNAGVKVGVGIGLGICVGVGVGVGLLFRSYQATTRNFKRRLI